MAGAGAANGLWVYEVTVTVAAEVRDEYAQVVRHHVDAISALPGFHQMATWHEEEIAAASTDSVTWVIRYFADDRAAIQNYFDTLAPTLRAETVQYGGKVSASRRILQPSGRCM